LQEGAVSQWNCIKVAYGQLSRILYWQFDLNSKCDTKSHDIIVASHECLDIIMCLWNVECDDPSDFGVSKSWKCGCGVFVCVCIYIYIYVCVYVYRICSLFLRTLIFKGWFWIYFCSPYFTHHNFTVLIGVVQLAPQHEVASRTHRSTINWIFTVFSLIINYWIDSGIYSAFIMIIINLIIDKPRLCYKITIKYFQNVPYS
jgi:hypothetical protein